MSSKAANLRELLTMDEVAEVLSCSRWMVYRLARDDKLQLVKLGRSSRVTRRSLDALLDEIMAKQLEEEKA